MRDANPRYCRLFAMGIAAMMCTLGTPEAFGKNGQDKASNDPPAKSDSTGESRKDEQPSETVAGLPAPFSGFADEGVFHLYLNEDRIATCTYKLEKDGNLKSKAVLSMAGQTAESTCELTTDPDGRWKSIHLETPLGPMDVVRDGTEGKITHKEKTNSFTLKEGAVLFENMTPVFLSHAVRRYDRAKGGKQSFPIFIIPQTIMDGWLEKKDVVERTVGGRDFRLTRYTYGLPGVDITVWADDAGKAYLAEVPSERANYVREGFESLRKEEEKDPLLSKAEFEIQEHHNVPVLMRDGVRLSTNIYQPKKEGKHPIVLVRTPYKKEMSELQGRFYARRGYVCAIQDCRGRFASEGEWEPFINEGKDGYDTIEWLAAQPWSNGKVGMIGASYLGWVQWWAAGQNPPHLVTIIPNVSPPDPFYNVPYDYGVFFLLGAIWWADVVESEATADLSGAAISKISEKKFGKLLRALPVIDLDKAVLGKENRYWRKWIDHHTQDPYWELASFLDRLKQVRIPVFHQSGWFDGDGIGSKLNYLRMRSHGHPHQKLVLGPWGHSPEAHRMIGERDFGEAAIIDLPQAYLRWFDHWLKGIDNGIVKEPLVSIFVMGSNKWLHGDEYPLPCTKFEKWFLTSGGKANTSLGDGRLTMQPPADKAPTDAYRYDPGDPTPTPAFFEEPEEVTASGDAEVVTSIEEKKKKAEAHHEKVTRERQDILVYASEPLTEPLTFAGPVSAVLYAATSERDTDWFMRLMEVDKEGKIFQLAEGKIRARFRKSMRKPEMLSPGEVVEYNIDLWQTGITIPAGHRIRVEVASASFPMFSRNLNTGDHNEKETIYVTAHQTIFHEAKYPSHVLLPVIPKEELEKK